MLLCLALIIPLAVLPNLVTAENQIDFRVLAAVAPVMLLYLLAAVGALADRARARLPVNVLAVAAWMVVAIAAVAAVSNVRTLFTRPATVEEAYFRAALSQLDPDAVDRVQVVVPSQGWRTRQRLGIFSVRSDLTHEWVPVPLVTLTLADRGVRWPASKVFVVDHPTPATPRVLTVDTTPLQSRL